MLQTFAKSLIKKYIMDPLIAITLYSSLACVIFLLVSAATINLSLTSTEVFLVFSSTTTSDSSSTRLPLVLLSLLNKLSSKSLIFFLFMLISSNSFTLSISSSFFSRKITLPSNCSSNPRWVTVKSTTLSFANTSGV
eukprot:NODE_73_length_23464_cov_0.600171.p9 type:complete len:137 gc:universal NODE_73_length_23464_cov_0.600171:12377-12787(+)